MHLELNGVTVYTKADASLDQDVEVVFEPDAFNPGLNELTWRYDTAVPNNWLTFDYHSLVFEPPPNGAMIIVR